MEQEQVYNLGAPTNNEPAQRIADIAKLKEGCRRAYQLLSRLEKTDLPIKHVYINSEEPRIAFGDVEQAH